jgi:hypothetical protein
MKTKRRNSSNQAFVMPERPQTISFAELRQQGVHGILVYCADYRYGRSIALMAEHWADDFRLSVLEPHLVCRACGIQFGGAFRLRIQAMRRCSSFLPAFSCARTQRGCFPRPDHLSAGFFGF